MEYQEFTRRLNELGSIITFGIAYFIAWRGLMVEDDESAHALNRYRGFFLPTRDALLWMTFMQLSKVFDRDYRTVSLSVLLDAAKANRTALTPQATEENLNDIEKQINDNEKLLIRLKNLRDQRIAHHDAIASDDRRILFGEVQKLVEDIKSMYNDLSYWHNNAYTSFDMIARDAERDTSEVVQIMRTERDRFMRRLDTTDEP
jgi:hypothetical protein